MVGSHTSPQRSRELNPLWFKPAPRQANCHSRRPHFPQYYADMRTFSEPTPTTTLSSSGQKSFRKANRAMVLYLGQINDTRSVATTLDNNSTSATRSKQRVLPVRSGSVGFHVIPISPPWRLWDLPARSGLGFLLRIAEVGERRGIFAITPATWEQRSSVKTLLDRREPHRRK